jgi:hypothetical protein
VWLANSSYSQSPAQQTFYYNPKGLSFIPPLSKPSIIYQGRLFVGRKQLNALFDHLNNEQLNKYYSKYKSNKTASTVFSLAGFGLSVYSFVKWRSGDDKFNWWTFGGGLACSLTSGYFNSKANQNLLTAAIIFDEATKKTSFVPSQPTITFSIPLSK